MVGNIIPVWIYSVNIKQGPYPRPKRYRVYKGGEINTAILTR